MTQTLSRRKRHTLIWIMEPDGSVASHCAHRLPCWIAMLSMSTAGQRLADYFQKSGELPTG